MRLVCAFAIAVLVGGCEDQPQAVSNQQDSPSSSKSSDSTRPVYPDGYAEMKVAAAAFAAETFAEFERKSDVDDDTGEMLVYYPIEDCQEPYENYELGGEQDPKSLEQEALARRIAKHEHFLKQLYDPAVFEGPLRSYEQAELQHIAEMPPWPGKDEDYESPASKRHEKWVDEGWNLKRNLADALEARRKRLQPNSVAVRLGGGCGAGEQAYLVKTAPAGGIIWMTSKFSFDLCRARRIPEWDTQFCRWTEVEPDDVDYYSGRYVYQARWPNGLSRRGVRTFDPAFEPAPDGGPAIVTISAR